MKRRLLIIGCLLAFCNTPLSAATENPAHQSTTVPDSARYEVVQSPLLAKLAFRLDRFTGETWQFVSNQDGGYGWQRIKKVGVQSDTKTPGKVNYQIFLSGIRAQITILINTTTGASWYITEDQKEGVVWSPMNN